MSYSSRKTNIILVSKKCSVVPSPFSETEKKATADITCVILSNYKRHAQARQNQTRQTSLKQDCLNC